LAEGEVPIESNVLVTKFELKFGRFDTIVIIEHEEIIGIHADTSVVHEASLAQTHQLWIHARESLHGVQEHCYYSIF